MNNVIETPDFSVAYITDRTCGGNPVYFDDVCYWELNGNRIDLIDEDDLDEEDHSGDNEWKYCKDSFK